MNLRHTPLAAALLAVFSAPVIAPQAAFAQTQQTENVLPEVQVTEEATETYAPGLSTVGGRVPTAVRDIPQSVTVINRAVLDAQNATTLTDALRNVPGITLGAGEGGVIGDNINIRGFSSRTDLFLDGMRDRAQYARETFFMESVEVLKGPSSMLFGRGSTGGVINQVSKQANLREFTEVGGSIGTDSYYRTTIDMNRPLSETSAFRINALAHTNDSTRDVAESERFGVAPSLRFGIGTPTEVTISSVHQRRKDIPDYGFPFNAGGTKENPARPIKQDRDNFYGFTDDKFDQDVDIATLRIEHKFSPNLSLRNQTQYSTARIDASPTTVTAAGVRNRREREIKDESITNQTDVIAKFDTGSVKHTLISGIEIARDNYENQGYDWTGEPNQDLSNPVYGPLGPVGTRTKTTFTDNRADTVGVYVNDTLELTKQWKLVGGLRWDRFEFDGKATTAAGVVTNSSQTDKMVSQRLGLLYQPTETQSYYVSYGTSFNPSAETVTLNADNDGVDPEKNRSVELGAKWDLMNGGLILNSSIFRVEKRNARSRNEFDEVIATGKTRVDGFELSAAGRITKNLEIFGGYTYLDGKIVNLDETAGGVQVSRDGNVLPNTPEHSATLWTNYRLGGGWEIGGGAVYASERLLNNANTSITSGYTRYDASIAYLTKQYDLRLNLQNLTDKEYFDVASGGRATPATGRTIIASVNYRF
ncbi:MAG: TonB-dependent receptor [Burkholderiaceae bacterium]